jgi:Na+/melibiose symporter-like transporter
MSAPPEIASDRQVSVRTRVFYGIGSIADGTKNAVFNGFLILYYTTVLGLPGTMSGLAIFIAMCVDGISDPLVGSVSDNFRSKWGRRHPFMYAAAVPMGLSFYGLFAPPEGLTEFGLFVWLTSFSIGVRLFLTLYMVPSGAMGPEMTKHYDERTSLVSYRWLIGWTGSIFVTVAGWTYFLDDAENTLGQARLEASNYPALGAFAGVVACLAILTSAAGTHHLIPQLRKPLRDGPIFSWSRFVREIRTALRSHSLRTVLLASLFAAAAMGIDEVLRTYMSTWFWELHTDEIGMLSGLSLVGLVAGVAMVRPLSERMDKRTAVMRLGIFAVLWGPLLILLRFAGIAPENGDPMLFWWIVAHGAPLVTAVIQIAILNSSMIMDAIDENEFETGERQEGVFISAITFTGKAVSGFGNFLGGVLLDVIDFPQGAAGAAVGNVPEATILSLGLIAGPGLTIFYLASVFVISRLRLTRERYAEIAAALHARREQP